MKTFVLKSGEHIVAEGAVSSEGTAVMFWLVEFEHITIWPDVETMLSMHQFELEWSE